MTKKLHQIAKFVFLLTASLWVGSWFFSRGLPATDVLLPQMLSDPVQEKISRAPVHLTLKDLNYTITPFYMYDLYGIVVTQYDSSNWLDIFHKNDPANARDICVVWGKNAKTGAYLGPRYKSGEFTCFVSWGPDQSGNPFDLNAFSNNHLIPADAQTAKTIRNVKIGDQIHFKGYLSDYVIRSKNGEIIGQRGTSVSRSDTGNGACEILYVTSAEILKPYSPILRLVQKVSKWGLALSAIVIGVLWFFTFRIRSKKDSPPPAPKSPEKNFQFPNFVPSSRINRDL